MKTDDLIMDAVKVGIVDAVKTTLTAYDSPLKNTIRDCVKKNEPELAKIVDDAIRLCVINDDFKAEIRRATREKLAKYLVQRLGGEIEKKVNLLKSNPLTRARITVALEEIVNEVQDRG